MAISTIGWLWIAFAAFGNDETLWGIGCLVFFPATFVYGLFQFDELKVPYMLFVGGIIGRIILAMVVGAMSSDPTGFEAMLVQF